MKELKFTVRTLSNLMIGGNESGFVIGGIDQHTVTDHEGKPYIPGSSFNGAFRKIIRDDKDEKINSIFSDYKKKIITKAEDIAKDPDMNINLEQFKKNLEKGIFSDSEYMFGIIGYNQSPKIMFSDLHLIENKDESTQGYFSIDAKNSIDNETLVANPRTYKVARKEFVFTGTIRFRNFDRLKKEDRQEIEEYIIKQLKVFNDGFYRLGNSKSRGYGHVEVKVTEVDGVQVGGY